jgi:hypothetical protein
MLLALAIAAGTAAQADRPPADVAIPKALREKREREVSPGSGGGMPVFANPLLAAALGPLVQHPGAWVEYLVVSKREPQVRVRASLLPQPAPEGSYWLEFATLAENGMAAAAKMLLHGNAFDGKNIDRIFVLLAGQQPIEIPLDELDLPSEKPPAPPHVEHAGKERVQVKAGTYEAEILSAAGARIWRSKEVPLWGLVQMKAKGESMELLAAGEKGAHSVFPQGWGDAKDPQGPAKTKAPQGTGSESTK